MPTFGNSRDSPTATATPTASAGRTQASSCRAVVCGSTDGNWLYRGRLHNPGNSMTRCKPFESELTAVNQQTRADRCMSLACTNIRDVEHDWLANLTELRETSYDATRGEMVVEGGRVGFRSQLGALRHRLSFGAKVGQSAQSR
jgi:hypothetical protein